MVVAVWRVAVRADVEAPTLAPGFYGGAFLKNRYISIDPTADGANIGKTFAIRVTLKDSLQFADAGGTTWWVGEPDENCLAGLVDDMEERNWDGCPELQVDGCGIVPVSGYGVSSVDSDGNSPTSLAIETAPRPGVQWWADVPGFFNGITWSPPNGTTSSGAVVAVLQSLPHINALTAAPRPPVALPPPLPTLYSRLTNR